MYDKILIAVDGSETSTRACQRAGALAKASGAAVLVTSVAVDRRAPADPWAEEPPAATGEDPQARADRAVREGVAALRAAGVEQVEGRVLRGLPAVALAHEAKQGGFDLLVVGHRGLSRFDSLRLGSVSEQLAHQAPCEVLIVP
jgi:nucleotide-binding universal stress UspA family protein